MRILVTGACGYIGNAAAKALRAAGHSVYGLVRTAANSGDLLRCEVIPVIGDVENVIVDDYSMIVDTATGMTAAEGKVSHGLLSKVLSFNSSNPSLKKTYVYTSGCLVYGDHPGELVTEETRLTSTQLGWRVELEKAILAGNQVVMRPGWVYGLSGGKMVPGWWKVDSPTADIVIKGKPDKMWSWIHVQDLAKAFVAVASASPATVGGQIFNVGDETRLTFTQLRVLMARAAGSEGKVVHEAGSGDSPFEVTSLMDSSKLKRVLGWHPRHASFADGMGLYFLSWKAHHAACVAKASHEGHKPPGAAASSSSMSSSAT